MSYRVYPVTDTAPICRDYTVRINGTVAPTNTARVSAMPFNRRWPGHQRTIDQTEAIQFLSLATDGPLEFEITVQDGFDPDALKIRPRSLQIKPTAENGVIRFTLPHAAYLTVEPFGRNRALHIFADPMPTYAIDRTAPDLLYFGPGQHVAGLIELKSNQTLYLDEGAVLYACIHAIDAQNVRILGRGILDNSLNKEEILFAYNAEGNREAINNARRRHTIELEYCTDVEIDGITIRDSLVYNIRPVGCRDLRVNGVKIIGCWRYNSDGIDMHNCENVRVSNCFIRTFDDSICVKGFDCYHDGDIEAAVHAAMYRNGMSYDRFCDTVIERCTVWNDWGKSLEIGAETKAEEIFDITFRNCDVIHVTGKVLDCMNVDYADVHDVTFEDIRIECDEVIPKPLIQRSNAQVYENVDPDYMPETVCAEVIHHHEYSAGSDRRGKNRRMTFKNVHLYGSHAPTAKFVGYDESHKTEDILLSDFYWNDKRVTADEIGWDVREFAENIRYE